MKVVNVRKDKCEVYGGRARGLNPERLNAGDKGWLGNPFILGADGDRDEIIRKYKRYFWERINEDKEFYDSVLTLKDKVVGCYCKPKACHLDVIVDWFESGCPLK